MTRHGLSSPSVDSMRTLHVNDVDLAVLDRGAGSPVVFVHGFPLDHSMWVAQQVVVAERWRTIVPDLLGFGASGVTPGRVTVEQHADDLAGLLDALGIADPVVLVGLSMGGYIAMQFYRTHRRRLRALVLCDTRAAADAPPVAAGRLEVADRVERDGPAVLADTMLPRLFSPRTLELRPELVERARKMILGGNRVGLAATSRGLAVRPDFSDTVPQIDCPTLLVVGRHDPISTPAEMGAMARNIAASQLAEIDDAGHLSPMERPDQVNRALVDFLDRIA